MLENIAISLQGIWAHKMRSLLTMLGIIIGIASIITIVSTIQGTNDQIKENLIGAGNNVVTVRLYQDSHAYEMNWNPIPSGVRVVTEKTRQELLQNMNELEISRLELVQAQQTLEDRRDDSDELLRKLVQKREEFLVLLAESEDAQDALMLQIAKKETELKEAQHDEYLARLAAQGSAPPSNASWITPVSGYTLTSPFGMRKHPVLGVNRMHNGIDMACPSGTPIYATRAGTVDTASYQAGGAGNYVQINHGDGYRSIYMHMTHYTVRSGQSVKQGQVIGYCGSTGASTGPHLHFGISYNGSYVNPANYIPI